MEIHPDAREYRLDVDGREVVLHDTGVPEDKRTPLVLVHGTGGETATHFRTVYPLLAARHRVIGIDWDAHHAPLELSDLVAQVITAIQSRACGTAVNLVGHSLGAVVSAVVAAKQPTLVQSLVLLGGWAKTDAQQLLRNDIWTALYATDEKILAKFSTFTAFGHPYLARRTPAEIEALVAGRALRPGVANEMELNRRIDIIDELQRVTAPTLIVGGSYDEMVPFRHSELLFGGILDARLAEIPCGHAMTTERPAHVFTLIDDFISAPEAQPAGAVVADTAI